MDTVGSLSAAEDIKRVKAAICRLIDQKDWEGLAEYLTEGCELIYGDGPEQRLQGRVSAVGGIARGLGSGPTTHQAFLPEIEISGETASAIWAMEDQIELVADGTSMLLEVYGHYADDYELGADRRWRLARSKSTALRQHIHPVAQGPPT